jgi:hypothetical protein
LWLKKRVWHSLREDYLQQSRGQEEQVRKRGAEVRARHQSMVVGNERGGSRGGDRPVTASSTTISTSSSSMTSGDDDDAPFARPQRKTMAELQSESPMGPLFTHHLLAVSRLCPESDKGWHPALFAYSAPPAILRRAGGGSEGRPSSGSRIGCITFA